MQEYNFIEQIVTYLALFGVLTFVLVAGIALFVRLFSKPLPTPEEFETQESEPKLRIVDKD